MLSCLSMMTVVSHWRQLAIPMPTSFVTSHYESTCEVYLRRQYLTLKCWNFTNMYTVMPVGLNMGSAFSHLESKIGFPCKVKAFSGSAWPDPFSWWFVVSINEVLDMSTNWFGMKGPKLLWQSALKVTWVVDLKGECSLSLFYSKTVL